MRKELTWVSLKSIMCHGTGGGYCKGRSRSTLYSATSSNIVTGVQEDWRLKWQRRDGRSVEIRAVKRTSNGRGEMKRATSSTGL